MADNNTDKNDDKNQKVIEMSKMVHKRLNSCENMSKKDIKTKLIEDIINTLKLMDIDSHRNSIEVVDDNGSWYFREDPIYTEIEGNNKTYIVGEEIGAGQFGFVKEFVHKESFKRYVVKIMDPERIAKRGDTYLELIKDEIKLVRKLNHKNVIRVFDFFSFKSNYYLILEYCFAVLEEYLENPPKKLPQSQSHLYFCQLIEGLDYLHSIGIIHRDIKPTNILINTSQQIKIIDFGVSKILDPFDESDMLVEVQGTPYYQPPEVYSEDFTSGYSGTKVDIWATGVVLYQMMSGQLPFEYTVSVASDLERLQFFSWIVNDHTQYPQEIVDNRELLSLLQKIFVKDFNQRITIEMIKRHPWFVLKLPQNDFRSIPPKLKGDLYRSLTIMPYIQTHIYPPSASSSSEDEDEIVSKQEYEESIDRTPNIRSNRLSSKRKVRNNRRIPPLRRLLRYGLGFEVQSNINHR